VIKIHNSATENTILLRCYGHGTSVIIDRRKELISLINLARLQMAPPLYGRFRNGFCYGFVPGQVLSPDQLSDNHIFKLIARKLARWHRIQMPTESSDGQNQPNAWKTIRNWLDQGNRRMKSLHLN
jgi:ethanolamine kinase